MDAGFRIATATAGHAEALWDALEKQLAGTPSFMVLSVRAHPEALTEAKKLNAQARHAGCALVGTTTALGVLDAAGFQDASLAAFAVRDPVGAYGAALAGEKKKEVAEALARACSQADRAGEKPQVVLALVTPGMEPLLLDALADEIGPDVPVVGGGAADDEVRGLWHVLAEGRDADAGAAIAVLFPSAVPETAFISGYAPVGPRARATRVRGHTLLELDGRPAADVYDAWTHGALASLDSRRDILAATTFAPLGMRTGTLAGVPVHLLLHPAGKTPEGGLDLFAAPQEGAEVALMCSDAEEVLARPALAVEGALARRGWRPEDVQGAWFAFCAGCMFGVRKRIGEAGGKLLSVLGHAPFQLLFTFGEIGRFVDGRNRHGNLMVSMLLFGPPS